MRSRQQQLKNRETPKHLLKDRVKTRKPEPASAISAAGAKYVCDAPASTPYYLHNILTLSLSKFMYLHKLTVLCLP
jgi:hypothetical protein